MKNCTVRTAQLAVVPQRQTRTLRSILERRRRSKSILHASCVKFFVAWLTALSIDSWTLTWKMQKQPVSVVRRSIESGRARA